MLQIFGGCTDVSDSQLAIVRIGGGVVFIMNVMNVMNVAIVVKFHTIMNIKHARSVNMIW